MDIKLQKGTNKFTGDLRNLTWRLQLILDVKIIKIKKKKIVRPFIKKTLYWLKFGMGSVLSNSITDLNLLFKKLLKTN